MFPYKVPPTILVDLDCIELQLNYSLWFQCMDDLAKDLFFENRVFPYKVPPTILVD